MAMSYERLLELFQQLGAKNPKSWARSEAKEDIPQLVRFLLLSGLWRCVIEEDDRWSTSFADPKDPIAGAIKRMLDKGIDPADLTDVVRDAQVQALYNVVQLLDDPSHGIEDLQESISENVEWRVIEYNGETEEVGRLVEGLHESFMRLDPSGRQGEPRQRKAGRTSKR